MKTTLITTKYIKQEDVIKEIELPDEAKYYFETGIRRSIALFPRWTTWQHNKGLPEEIWEYDLVLVYLSWETKIETLTLRVSNFSQIYSQREKSAAGQLLEFLISADECEERTREQFMKDYNTALSNYNKILENETTNSTGTT